MTGPLEGLRVIELAGIGPGPFCAMMLADMGAEVLRIDRPREVPLGTPIAAEFDFTRRNRRSAAVDLRHADGAGVVLRLAERADALIEGFRPGVAERLGVGPEACLERNPKLVYGRMTGWGQDGPLAGAAGHDANYIALSGALHTIGPADGPPIPPLNLVGDFGGGALYLAFGVMAAVFEAGRSGRGQIVDAAMVDGAASLMAPVYGRYAAGMWIDERGRNVLDGGCHFYGVYETRDAKYVAIAAIEPKFYAELLERIGLGEETLPEQWDEATWPDMRARFEAIFRQRTREEWRALLEGTDTCFAPVLSLSEAAGHPHMAARGTFVDFAGVRQPGPAPRFSRTAPDIRLPPATAGKHTDEALGDWGFSSSEIAALRQAGAVGLSDDD
jgi:alpha-methylacyl-CoA racemase